MTETELQSRILSRFDLCIEPEMARYALRQIAENRPQIPVIGGDWRTGVPRRQVIDPSILREATELEAP